ncbi:tripartite tricarboxylate transporter TctB family protein [Clostridium sp. AM58-1XD]|uniref:tripartite tricarboxylate transporter TctB family protein n=1 Tax=Clostridium sp. AM58-1XD TaxID=2292307 RepID=UPI000E51BD90|nr:tripartite tricarboxylate transporter TctB family protein [Clostridium sp. AM58-1XD]RGZ00604.1 tripartite tricarboxylate transporter TctB family protein [Clostridium sp. AM58-1XD]
MRKLKIVIHQDVITAVFLLAAGLYFFTKGIMYEGVTKVFPIMTSAFVFIFSLWNMREALKKTKALKEALKQGDEQELVISLSRLKGPLIGFAFILIYGICIPLVGFFTATGIFLIALMRFLNYKKWAVILSVTVGTELFVYFLFVKELMVRIPHGCFY